MQRVKKDFLAIDTPKDLLITLLMVGGVVAATSLGPTALAPVFAVKVFQKEKRRKKKYVQAVYYARRNNLIKYSKNKDKVVLTPKGMERAKRHVVRSLPRHAHKRREWDGIWRVFVYDIPAQEDIKRRAVRDIIKKVGMMLLQKSVWVYPFDCKEEIEFTKKVFSLSDDSARLILAKNIGNDVRFKKHFRI